MPGETGLRHLTAAAGTRRQRRSERPKGARGRLQALMVAQSYTIRVAPGTGRGQSGSRDREPGTPAVLGAGEAGHASLEERTRPGLCHAACACGRSS